MRDLVITLVVIVASLCNAQLCLEVHNYGISARVDTTIGFFGVGTNPGGSSLTWDFVPVVSGVGNSHFIVRVDGETYGLAIPGSVGSFTPFLTSVLDPYNDTGFPRLITTSNTIHNKWNLPEGITVNQYFKPHSLDDSLGLIQVRYVIRNDDDFDHTIGLEHKWDVNINGVDDAPIASPASPYVDTNSVFTPADMPPYILIPNDPDTPTLVGVMVVDAFDATCPDFFAYGEEMEIIVSNFSLDSTFAGPLYWLSAALIRWDDVIVPSGGDLELITYYGIGYDYASIEEFSTRPGDFALSAHPNPFNSSVTIAIDGVGDGSPVPFDVEIYDVNGRRVAELPVGEGLKPSRSLVTEQTGGSETTPLQNGKIIWTPDPSLGSGVYLVRAVAGDVSSSKRIVFLK